MRALFMRACVTNACARVSLLRACVAHACVRVWFMRAWLLRACVAHNSLNAEELLRECGGVNS